MTKPATKRFRPSDWFERLFGFVECQALADTQAHFELRDTTLISKKRPDRPFKAGQFETVRLADIRRRVEDDKLLENQRMMGKLCVREVVGDVSLLHAQSENRYSLFQAASQFNCLEHPTQHGVPEDGITCYANDKTQGPACATACAAGTAVRNDFTHDGKGQNRIRQIENLADVERVLDNSKHAYFSVRNGCTNDFSAWRQLQSK